MHLALSLKGRRQDGHLGGVGQDPKEESQQGRRGPRH